jgi:hypothetical protein
MTVTTWHLSQAVMPGYRANQENLQLPRTDLKLRAGPDALKLVHERDGAGSGSKAVAKALAAYPPIPRWEVSPCVMR